MISTICILYLFNLVPEIDGQINTYGTTYSDVDDCDNNMSELEVMNVIYQRYNAGGKQLSEKGATTVQVEIHVQGISEISETTASFEADLLFSQLWRDPNLNFSTLPFCKKNITLDPKSLTRIWTPNTCIVNSRTSKIHRSPTPNLFVILYKNGTVWVNYRVKASGSCNLDLRMFPFDTQTCNLAFESYSYNNKEVRLEWFPKPLEFFDNAVQLPDFELAGSHTTKRSPVYPNGQWDRLEVFFTFKRRFAFYILQAYIPTYIIIATSWISFCIDYRILPARTTITVSALLAITFQYGNIIKSLPKVSYIKAMDVWMLASISFVFAALLELAVICIISRRPQINHVEVIGRHRLVSLVPVQRHDILLPVDDSGEIRTGKCKELVYQQRAHSVDLLLPNCCDSNAETSPTVRRIHHISKTRWVGKWRGCHQRSSKECCSPECIDTFFFYTFPFAFVCFNVVYWSFYLSRSMNIVRLYTESIDANTGHDEEL